MVGIWVMLVELKVMIDELVFRIPVTMVSISMSRLTNTLVNPAALLYLIILLPWRAVSREQLK